eukprot:309113-Chlamydomonas_euryale.AAC.1
MCQKDGAELGDGMARIRPGRYRVRGRPPRGRIGLFQLCAKFSRPGWRGGLGMGWLRTSQWRPFVIARSLQLLHTLCGSAPCTSARVTVSEPEALALTQHPVRSGMPFVTAPSPLLNSLCLAVLNIGIPFHPTGFGVAGSGIAGMGTMGGLGDAHAVLVPPCGCCPPLMLVLR